MRVDADSGEWAWRAELNYPVVSGMTPTAGGVTFWRCGGNFYALDSATGEKIWAGGRRRDRWWGDQLHGRRLAESGGQRFHIAKWPTQTVSARSMYSVWMSQAPASESGRRLTRGFIDLERWQGLARL